MKEWLRNNTYPTRMPLAPLIWALILFVLFAWLDHRLSTLSIWLVPPFAAMVSILLYLPQQTVAQPLPVILGSTLGSLIGTLVALFTHGPMAAAFVAAVLLWLLPRIGLYHPPAIALSMYPLLLKPGPWFPFVVVLPFTLVAVLSHIAISRIWPSWPSYPRRVRLGDDDTVRRNQAKAP